MAQEAATTPQAARPLLEVTGLKQYFKIPGGNVVKAVDDISFDIMPGETFGLVGESGSGKSTTGRAVIRLDDITAGKIVFDGDDISGKMSREVEDRLRTNMSMVFQDPMASLNPYRKVIDTIATGLDAHEPNLDRREREQRVYEIMDRVGLSRSQTNRYPSQFSGGQRQRVGLARALIMNPKLLIADEAISALDVSIQAQVVNLMKDIQDETGAAYLFIAHDLSMVRYISRRIAVMHLGHIVEAGFTDEIFADPVHPYTKALISAIPRFNPQVERGRRPLVYDAGEAGIRYDEGTYHAVSATHQVLATDEQIEAWVK
ncbi:MAG: ABC transporter ATP-binding protein [Atopobiaceae bacterium]|nr:ABC transporter ATP-binding protein [Atopobiaceae bacterium]